MDSQSAPAPKDVQVLVVENSVQLYLGIARMLAHLGVKRCEWKPPGWDVVGFAATMPRVDLILMNVETLPKCGEIVLNELRSRARFQSTRVVAMASTGGIDVLSKTMALGFDGFLHTPLSSAKFPKQILQVLEGESIWDWGPSSRPE